MAQRLRRRLLSQAARLEALEQTRRAEPVRWGFEWGRHYLPHYFANTPADFHGPLFEQLQDLHKRRGAREAIVAPREGAKSTLITLAYVLRCVVERLEPFILILSDSADQAEEKLADVRREIEGNARLTADFPDACGIGPQWRNDRIELRNGVVIQAIGRRGRVRGRRNRADRPSLIVFDDVENNVCITSQTEREATWRWATREVIPAGHAGTNYLSVGSALHPQCVAVRLGQLAGWRSQRYQAIHEWPERMDLWERWERMATNLGDENRARTAERFFEANGSAMIQGAKTYWPARWSLLDLMKRRAEIGAAAFTVEYQGIPTTEGLTEFPPEFFDKPGLWFDEWPHVDQIVYRVQSLDPSKGSDSKSGDYQAHVLVALCRDGQLYVQASLQREQIGLMVERGIRLSQQAEFGVPHSVAIENNDSLGMVVGEFQRRLRELEILLPIEGVLQKQNKIVRVRRLGLYFARGRIRFRNTPGTRLLVEQLREFPQGDHDDGPDALELAIRRIELAFQDKRTQQRTQTKRETKR